MNYFFIIYDELGHDIFNIKVFVDDKQQLNEQIEIFDEDEDVDEIEDEDDVEKRAHLNEKVGDVIGKVVVLS